jgi:DNA (cytosine-5)-methyltransferase 1
MVSTHKFPYEWTLRDSNFTKDKGKVFSCFSCGGGSTMGYKLAGFDVIGCNEIDPKMMEAYKANHNPKYAFLEPIQTFKLRNDLPGELYDLDILDGSPPCSSFSTGGNRDKDWGKAKKFKEGQAMQVLDTLFFDFIDLAKELQPKVVVAENVKGLLLGNAKSYVIQIYNKFEDAGYYCQHFLLDASKMGVPQNRERVIFLAFRKDLAFNFLHQADMFSLLPKIDMVFNEPVINFSDLQQIDDNRKPIIESYLKYFNKANQYGVYDERANGGIKFGFYRKAMKNRPLATIMSGNVFTIEEEPMQLNTTEFSLGQSFPLDYNFLENEPQYLIGMSVPPVMTAQIASNIYDQWLSKLEEKRMVG